MFVTYGFTQPLDRVITTGPSAPYPLWLPPTPTLTTLPHSVFPSLSFLAPNNIALFFFFLLLLCTATVGQRIPEISVPNLSLTLRPTDATHENHPLSRCITPSRRSKQKTQEHWWRHNWPTAQKCNYSPVQRPNPPSQTSIPLDRERKNNLKDGTSKPTTMDTVLTHTHTVIVAKEIKKKERNVADLFSPFFLFGIGRRGWRVRAYSPRGVTYFCFELSAR